MPPDYQIAAASELERITGAVVEAVTLIEHGLTQRGVTLLRQNVRCLPPPESRP